MLASEYSKQVGSLIRKHRLEMGLTEKELTKRAGLSKNYVEKVERGEKEIGILQLRRIAKELVIDVRDLLP